MAEKQFKTTMFGYDKAQVDEAMAKNKADMEALVEDSKNKIKQAQTIATQANKRVDELEKELKKIKYELEQMKKKS